MDIIEKIDNELEKKIKRSLGAIQTGRNYLAAASLFLPKELINFKHDLDIIVKKVEEIYKEVEKLK